MTSDDFDADVIILGGGPAGLNAAVALGRSRRSVLVLDSGAPRNAPAAAVHNFLTRDGTPPSELLALARAEAESYGAVLEPGEVVAATRRDTDAMSFTVDLTDGRTRTARRLLIASGLVDELPELPGVRERWGRDVLHCPYCHGFEVRDQAIGILATTPFAVHQAGLFRQLSDDVTVFLHGGDPLPPEQAEPLAARGIRVVAEPVASLVIADDRLVGLRLESGEVVARDALVVAPRFVARAGFLTTLGIEAVDQQLNGFSFGAAIEVDPNGATRVPGVWAAGNVTDLRAQVITAAGAGLTTGAMINADLVAEETRAAVEAYRVAQPVG